MDKGKGDALLKAAHSGAVQKIRELLAAGAPLEARDVNRKTAVMLAADSGHSEAFGVLVEAGADLHAVGFGQMDLLEVAARAGNVTIVRFLLERGLPVNGHWQGPAAPALRKFGHQTPLIQATLHGRVEVVRMLLEAGADRQAKADGKTALEHVKARLRDPVYAERRQAYREIAALLGDEQPDLSQPMDAVLKEVAKFAQGARSPDYASLRQRLNERCGPAKPWKPVPDHGVPAEEVIAFTLAGSQRQKTLEELQEQARQAGCHLVLDEMWAPNEDASLVLFPTDNKLAVVAAVGTEGSNYEVQTADVIAWLETLDKENPFHLVLCNHELVGGAFVRAVKKAQELAERMIEFCPCCLDEAFEDAEELARALKKQKSFLLRWD